MRLILFPLSIVLFFQVSLSFGQSSAKDYFPKQTLWFNSSEIVTFQSLKTKLVVVMISDMDCLECAYFAKQIELSTQQLPAVQLIEVFLPSSRGSYTRSEINNYIQKFGLKHPVAVVPDLSGFLNSSIGHAPSFILYDRSETPLFTLEGIVGFERVMDKITQLKDGGKELKNQYSSFQIIPDIDPTYFANPVIELPTYITASDNSSNFYVNDQAHYRILEMSRRGECENIAGSSVLPGFDNDEEGSIRFLHPSGIVTHNGQLYVADTYNNRLRLAEPEKYRATTILGNGSIDSLALPTDIEVWKNKMYVCDGLYNQIRKVDLAKRTSTVFANLPSKYIRMSRVYPINLSSGRKYLYVVMSNGEVISLDKKGRQKTISTPENIRFTSVVEWQGGMVACSPDDNSIYFNKKGKWKLLTKGGENTGTPSFNRPFDLAVIGGELYVTDSENHLIRIIHSVSDNTPQIYTMQLSERLISEESAHTYGQAVELDSIFISDKSVQVKVKLNLQGYEIVESELNYLVMHNSPAIGQLKKENITEDEFEFTVNPGQADDAVYIEFYITLEHPDRPGVPIIKRSYLYFPLEHFIEAEAEQEMNYTPDLLPH